MHRTGLEIASLESCISRSGGCRLPALHKVPCQLDRIDLTSLFMSNGRSTPASNRPSKLRNAPSFHREGRRQVTCRSWTSVSCLTSS